MRSCLSILIFIFLSSCAEVQTSGLRSPIREGLSSSGGQCTSATHEVRPQVLYGPDGRKDAYEVSSARELEWLKASALLVEQRSLSFTDQGVFKLKSFSYKALNNLCESEKFVNQRSAGFCSGFLVSEDILVTAGHCTFSPTFCETTKFVFGYAQTAFSETASLEVPEDQVYSCAQILKKQFGKGQDFAVIQLDRKVKGITPLDVLAQPITPRTPATVVGYPSGLPAKLTIGGEVISRSTTEYLMSLDTYEGSSGAAVIDHKTGGVVGILVRGEDDFVRTPKGCYVSNQCDGKNCKGESVFRIDQILGELPGANKINNINSPNSCNI